MKISDHRNQVQSRYLALVILVKHTINCDPCLKKQCHEKAEIPGSVQRIHSARLNELFYRSHRVREWLHP